MKTRYFIWLQYDGTEYNGWQVQNNAITVQEITNKALSTLLRDKIESVGAGRTDTGVHALGFAAHFDYHSCLPSNQLDQLTYKLNCVLPFDVAVRKMEIVKPHIHARFSATSRTYQYLINTTKNPFLINKSWYVPQELSLELMREATSQLLCHDDFKSFCKANSGASNYKCKIMGARWEAGQDLLKFEITADRFLRNMVRAIVGTLVDVGLGKTSPGGFRQIIESRSRSKAGLSVPACGLYFQSVAYPDDYNIVGNLK